MSRHTEAGRGAEGAAAAGAQQQRAAGGWPPTSAATRSSASRCGSSRERGFRGTTTKEIAQAAGVSEAIIFRHFATKEDLYTAIIDHKALRRRPADPDGRATRAARRHRRASRCVAEAVEATDDRAVFARRRAPRCCEHHEGDPEFLRLLMYIALEGHELGADVLGPKRPRALRIPRRLHPPAPARRAPSATSTRYVVVRAFLGTVIHHSLINTALGQRPRAPHPRHLERRGRARSSPRYSCAASRPTRASAPRGRRSAASRNRGRGRRRQKFRQVRTRRRSERHDLP